MSTNIPNYSSNQCAKGTIKEPAFWIEEDKNGDGRSHWEIDLHWAFSRGWKASPRWCLVWKIREGKERKKKRIIRGKEKRVCMRVCVSGTRRREKEKQRRRAVTLTPCNREKPVEQHGIKPRLEEWLSAGAWLKTGVQYRNNRWHPVCVCCSSREGEKKKFSFRGFTVRQRFSAVCLETRRRLLEYYFRSVWKRQAANYPAKWSVKTNRDVHGIHSLADVSQTVWSGAN